MQKKLDLLNLKHCKVKSSTLTYSALLRRQNGQRKCSSMALRHKRQLASCSPDATGWNRCKMFLSTSSRSGSTRSFPRTPAMFFPSSSLGSKSSFSSSTAKLGRDLADLLRSNKCSVVIPPSSLDNSLCCEDTVTDADADDKVESKDCVGAWTATVGDGKPALWMDGVSNARIWSTFLFSICWFWRQSCCVLIRSSIYVADAGCLLMWLVHAGRWSTSVDSRSRSTEFIRPAVSSRPVFSRSSSASTKLSQVLLG